MPTDIYGNEHNYVGNSIITAHEMVMSIAGGSSAGGSVTAKGALVQNVTIQYSQPVQIIREVGSKNYYYYTQLPQGTVSFGRLVAHDSSILDLLPREDSGPNIWKVPGPLQENPLVELRALSGGLRYLMKQCIVESIGINVDSNAQFVQEQIAIRFGSMNIEEGGEAVL